MANERKLTVTILGDSKSAGQAFDDLGNKADGVGSKLGALKTSAGLAFAGMGAGAVAFGKAGIDAASDMRESMGKMEQIFNTRAEMAAVSASKMMDDAGTLTKAQEKYAEAMANAEGKVGKERDKAVAKANEWRDKVTKAQAAVNENERLNAEAHAKFMKEGAQLGDEYGKSIEEWAGKSATAFGQSKQQAIDAAANFALFGKAAGQQGKDLVDFSTTLTGLASDLASFNNTSPEQAINALGAALRGESEPMRQYGVMLNDAAIKAQALKMGIYDGTGELDAQAKTMAAYQVILSQTKDAQGDFARTSDGMANQQRIMAAQMEDLKVKVGQALLPVMMEATKIFTGLANVLGPLIVDLADKLGPALEKAVGWFKDLAKVFNEQGLGGLFEKLGGDIAGAWEKTIKPALGDMLGKIGAWIKDNGPGILRQLGEWTLAFGGWVKDDLIPALLGKLGDLVGAIGAWAKENGPGIIRQLGEWTGAFLSWVATDLVPKLVGKLGDVAVAIGRWAKDNGPAILGQLGEWTAQFIAWAAKLPGEIGEWAVRNAPKLFGWLADVAPKIALQLGKWTLEFVGWLADLGVELGREAIKAAPKFFGWLADMAVDLGVQLAKWTGAFIKWVTIDLPLDLAKMAAEFAGKGLGWIADMASGIPEQLASWTGKFADWVVGLPKDLSGGMVELVKGLGAAVFDAFTTMWDKAARAVNRKIPFKDPIPTFGGGDSGPKENIGDAFDIAAGVTAKVTLEAATETLKDDVQKALNAFKPKATIDPQVDPEDMVRLAGQIGKGVNTAMKNPGNAISLLLNDPEFQETVRASTKVAVEKVSVNPPAKVQVPVDQENHDVAVATTAKTAVEKLNATPVAEKAQVQVPVDEAYHGEAMKATFANAVTQVNGWADRLKVMVEANQDHLTNDTKGKAAQAVTDANAALVASNTRITVEAVIDKDKLVAQAKEAYAAAAAAAKEIFGALGNASAAGIPSDPGPKPTNSAPLGARQGAWVMTIRGWEIWDGNGGGANLAGWMGASGDPLALQIEDASRGPASRGADMRVAVPAAAAAGAGGTPIVVVATPSAGGAFALGGDLTAGRGGVSGSGAATLVGSGGTVVNVENLIGELQIVGGSISPAQAKDIARQIYEPFRELVFSKGHTTVNGSWRIDS